MSEPALKVHVLASPLQGQSTGELLGPVVAGFRERAGLELIPLGEGEADDSPLLSVLLLTGGTERKLVELAARRPGPVLVLTHPAQNSLAAGLEAVARLKRDGRRVVLYHLGGGRRGAEPGTLVRAVELARFLRGKRVGLIGEPSPWLVASVPDEAALQDKLGLELVRIPLSEVLSRVPSQAPPVAGPGEGIGPAERAIGPRVEAALSGLVEDYRLDAFTIACFGLLPHGLTACWALARLADRGIPAGCEGDLVGLVALLFAQGITGGPGFLANPVDVDPRGERLLLAHCTVPLSLTQGYLLRTHFESGIGLAVAGELSPGPYTLVRLGGKRLEQLFAVEGTVLPEQPRREDLCRTQAVFKAPRGALEKLLSEPLGNHHVLIPGHHRALLTAFHGLFLAE